MQKTNTAIATPIRIIQVMLISFAPADGDRFDLSTNSCSFVRMCSALRQAQDTAWQSKEHGLNSVLRSIVKAYDSVRPLFESNLQGQLMTEAVDVQGNGLIYLMAHQNVKERVLRVNGVSTDSHNHVAGLQARLAG